jgi:hypothetical protein
MPLTLRPTALSSPAYRDWADYIVREDSRAVGRIYKDRHTLPGLRWFWSITMYVNPKLGITTSGRAPIQSRPGFRSDVGHPAARLCGSLG